MSNDKQQITGYRKLSDDEAKCINEIKALEAQLAHLTRKLRDRAAGNESGARASGEAARWVAIGRTHLEQGFMALVRSVARPESPWE